MAIYCRWEIHGNPWKSMEIPYKWRVCSENHRSKCVANCNASIAETSTHFPGWMLACGIVTELPGATQSTWDFQESHRSSGNRGVQDASRTGPKPHGASRRSWCFYEARTPKSSGLIFFRFGRLTSAHHDPNLRLSQEIYEIFKS